MKLIHITTHDGQKTAAHKLDGELPTVIFMPGFFSNMERTKATFLEKQWQKRGQSYIRFDYRGHGQSDSKFEDGTITDWLNDSLLVLDELADAPVVAVGSSMGGWIAMLAALRRPDNIRGLLGIASSPDFTEDIWHRRMTDQQQKLMNEHGYIVQPSEYRDEPVIIAKQLIDSGKDHLLLNKKSLSLDIPVTLIHGMQDRDVLWQKSEKLNWIIGEEQSELILVPDGAHRLSRDKDLELIDREIVKHLKKV